MKSTMTVGLAGLFMIVKEEIGNPAIYRFNGDEAHGARKGDGIKRQNRLDSTGVASEIILTAALQA